MNLEGSLNRASSVNEVYNLLIKFLRSTVKNSICILIQLDEKRDEALVYDIIGLSDSLLIKSIKTFRLNPIGKRFKNTKHGRENFYHSNQLQKFSGNLYQFSEGVFSQWVCKTIEKIFRLDNIYTIGLNYEHVLIGTVFIFPRNNDIVKFKEVEDTIPLFSKRMKEILDSYKNNIIGGQVKERFTKSIINNLSHEIRTPLNGMVGLMDAGLKLLNTNPDARGLSDAIWENTNELTNKLDNLLHLADFESNSVVLDKKEYSLEDINTYLGKIIAQPLNGKRRREIKFDGLIDYIPSTKIILDINFFEVAIFELIKNALKYSNSLVSVKFKYDDKAYIEIADHGVGMCDKQIATYFNINTDHKLLLNESNGLGIGISLVKFIVQKHQWDIQVDSELGSGTSVKISL